MVRVSSRAARWVLALAVVLGPVLVGHAAPVLEGNAPKAAETPAEKLRKDLDKPVTIEITEQSLPLAMNQLRDQTKVNIVLDRFALNQMGIDPEQMPVTVNVKETKLRSALRTILGQHNLSFAVVGDSVIVSTDEICLHRQLRQRVSVDVEKGELGSTLRKLARETGTNLLLDPKVAKEATAPVTMQLDDVPFETAVKLMTEMAGLKTVRVGNVLFVCSKTTAAEMRQDPDLMPGGNPGIPPGIDFPRPGFFPGGMGGIQILPGNAVPPAQPAVPPGGEPARGEDKPVPAPVPPKDRN